MIRSLIKIISGRSLFVIAAFFLLFGTLIYNRVQPELISKDFYAKRVLYKEKQILAHLNLSEYFIEGQNLDQLSDLLIEAAKNDLFDWFVITYDDQPLIAYPEHLDILEKIDRGHNQDVITNDVSYSSRHFQNSKYIITIGLNKSVSQFVKKTIEENTASILQDIFIPVILAIIVFFILLKDIMEMIKISRNKRSQERIQSLYSLNSKSIEAQHLQESLLEANNNQLNLYQEVQNWKSQVMPALKKEWLESRGHSSSFEGCLVRLDINNYTQIFSNTNPQILDPLLLKYFKELAEIIQCYGGYLKEFVGDEALFYFKGEQKRSVPVAAACIRDIMQWTEEFHNDFAKITSYSFNIKACANFGQFRTRKHLFGLSISSPCFIETQRALGQVKDKSKNSVIWIDNSVHNISFADIRTLGQHDLKGLSKSYELYSIEEFRNMQDRPEDILFFRSNKDLQIHLANIQYDLNKKSNTLADRLKFLLQWPDYLLQKIDYSRMENEILALCQEQGSKETSIELSCFSSLLRKSSEFYSSANFDKIIHEFLKSKDQRVVANTIEIISQKMKNQKVSYLKDFIRHPYPRTQANTLLALLENDWNENWVRVLLEMLLDSDERKVHSALYVVDQIQKQFYTFDRILLMNSKNWKLILKQLEVYKQQASPAIQVKANKLKVS